MVQLMKKLMIALGLVVGLSGCATIHFDNAPTTTTKNPYSEWHHDGILRLVEFSPPVDMNNRCDGANWVTTKVERNFVQGLAAVVTWGIYDPWDVSYACAQAAAAPATTKPTRKKR